MKGDDFSAWLSAISGMNEGQRAEAIAPLEKASAVGAEGGTCAKKGGMGTLYQDNIPVLVARDRKGATFDALLPQLDGLP
jgi:hypothetical protein